MIAPLARAAGRVALATPVAAIGAWGAAALHFHPPLPAAGDFPALVFVAVALAAATAVVLARRTRPALALFCLCFLAIAAWWGGIAPAGSRAWAPELARVPHADVVGDTVTVDNVRDFDWRSESDYTAAWETRTYRLSDLVSTDLIAVYWAGPSIAHTIVSFGFADGRHLAFSIEVRHAAGEDYSAVPGLFKKYELIFVAADERDVLGLRRVRHEDPYMFRLRVDPARARPLFLEYLKRASDLSRKPVFYNTLTTNCTTVIFSMVRSVGFDPPWNWRVLVSGYLPDLAYDEGLLASSYTLADLRRLGDLSGKLAPGLGSAAFSTAIRAGIPAPR